MKYKAKKIAVEQGCIGCAAKALYEGRDCEEFRQARVADGLPDCLYTLHNRHENIIYVKDSKPRIKLELTHGQCVNCALAYIADCLVVAEQLDLPCCNNNTCYTVKVKGYK